MANEIKVIQRNGWVELSYNGLVKIGEYVAPNKYHFNEAGRKLVKKQAVTLDTVIRPKTGYIFAITSEPNPCIYPIKGLKTSKTSKTSKTDTSKTSKTE